MSQTRYAVEFDFGGEGPAPGQTEQDVVNDWVARYAPGCEGAVVGRANGYPVVRVSATSPEALIAPVVAYDAGNGGVDMFLDDAYTYVV